MDLGKLGGLGDKLRENEEAIKNKVQETADKLIDSKLDGDKAQKAKDAVRGGLDKGVDEVERRLGVNHETPQAPETPEAPAQ
ncbi:hypothetical protein [Corynebacterium aquilae]|uniref:Antitoxin n=1 Tax=Corynebacterium aquilae DSM 44791 TaxID=1431546 RepID=A0A1L7CDB1_9CORY|nr:hypothetical protein [Corynebacterium aquilae]APT83828.1 hypothetical protein CAQU_00575 [Corynebacterium aquilae DSM 44791]